MLILSGVESPAGALAFDGDSDSAAPADPATSVQEIDSDLDGSIGDVLVATLSILLADTATTTTVPFDAAITTSGGIFATDSIGNVQALNQGTFLDAPGEGIIIGDDTMTITEIGKDEILVLLV